MKILNICTKFLKLASSDEDIFVGIKDDFKLELKLKILKDTCKESIKVLYSMTEAIDNLSMEPDYELLYILGQADELKEQDLDTELYSGERFTRAVSYIKKLKNYFIALSKYHDSLITKDESNYFSAEKEEYDKFLTIIIETISKLRDLLYKIINVDEEVSKKMLELIEQDWRPGETIPEDYYAL